MHATPIVKIIVAPSSNLLQSALVNNDIIPPTRTFRTVSGYQGFSVCVNGVTVSTLVCHGDIPSGGNLEREYIIGDGVRSLWHPTESPFETAAEIGTRVSLREFREICRRHGLEFSSRRF